MQRDAYLIGYDAGRGCSRGGEVVQETACARQQDGTAVYEGQFWDMSRGIWQRTG